MCLSQDFVLKNTPIKSTTIQIFLDCLVIAGLLLMASPLSAWADDKAKELPTAKSTQVAATVVKTVN